MCVSLIFSQSEERERERKLDRGVLRTRITLKLVGAYVQREDFLDTLVSDEVGFASYGGKHGSLASPTSQN